MLEIAQDNMIFFLFNKTPNHLIFIWLPFKNQKGSSQTNDWTLVKISEWSVKMFVLKFIMQNMTNWSNIVPLVIPRWRWRGGGGGGRYKIRTGDGGDEIPIVFIYHFHYI